MRKPFLIPTVIFGVLVFVLPHFTYAALNTNNFGPIVTNNICNCNGQGSAPDYGCLLGVLQNAFSIFASFSIVIITIYIAWAGVTYMLNPTSPEARSKANKRLINAVLGLLIILCSWLLVDTVMKVIYNSNASGSGVSLGPWNSIISQNGKNCLTVQNAGAPPALLGAGNAGGGVATTPPPISGAGGACNASTIQSAVQAEGGSISSSDASVLACLAAPESSCGTNPKALVPQNNGSSALGPFQVTVQSHAALFNNAQCEAAAGVSGPLNCQTAFRGGNPIPGSTLTACQKAADDIGCEAVVAAQVYHTEHIAAWTKDPRSTIQGSCGQ